MRHSLVFWTATEQIELNRTIQPMLVAILDGFKTLECGTVIFKFTPGKRNTFTGCVQFTPKEDHFKALKVADYDVFEVDYEITGGLGPSLGFQLLLSEVQTLNLVMTQGQVGRSELFSLDSGDHWLLFEFNRRH